jgi:hypothetical protein
LVEIVDAKTQLEGLTMMQGILKNAIPLVACLIFSSSAARTDFARHNPWKALHRDEQIEMIPFCKLTKHPERYVNKVIKTSAIFLTHFPDVWFMYDQNCSDKNSRVSDYLNCKSDAECDRLRKLMPLHRDGDGEKWRNKMVVVGALLIVNRTDGSGRSTRVLKFAISDIESVSAVPQRVPWP